MNDHFYSYEFKPCVSMREARQALRLAAMVAEILHGAEAVRLDGGRRLSPNLRVCVIEGSTAVGRDIARLFSGFLARQFGPEAFKVRRREGEFEGAAFADKLCDEELRRGGRR